MKSIEELNLPGDVRYSKDHEWLRAEGDQQVTVGISDYAQDQMGDVVFVELPEVGDSFEPEEAFGTVESVKAVNELFMPVGGEVVAINGLLEETPEVVNQDPYGRGWMIRIKIEEDSQMDDMLDQETYVSLLKG